MPHMLVLLLLYILLLLLVLVLMLWSAMFAQAKGCVILASV